MEGRRWCTGGSGGNFKMTQTLTQTSLTQLLDTKHQPAGTTSLSEILLMTA